MLNRSSSMFDKSLLSSLFKEFYIIIKFSLWC